MNVTFTIVHYKSLSDTLECLDSLQNIKSGEIKINVLVINNSQDFKINKKLNYRLEVLNPEKNLGFAGGNNLGLKKVLYDKSEYIILLNNDTILSPDFLVHLINFSQKHPQAGLVSPKVYFAPGFEYHKDRYTKKDQGKVIWYAGGKIDWNNIYAQHIGVDEVDQGQFEKPMETDFTTGCCLLIKKDAIEKIGLFDENYFLYYEDVDYSVRAKKKGFKVFFTPDSIIWHKNASSSGKPGSNLHIYFQTRNRLYFGSKYASLRAKVHLYREALHNLLAQNNAQRQAIQDFLLHNMGRGSYKL